METLRPWIVPLVEAALCSCLGQPLPEELALRKPLKLVDDNSNLRVHVRDPRIVQVAQWSTASGPIRGTLSDSVTTILSIFCSESTERYRNKNKKQLNKNTMGAVIKINEFEIVISYLRARAPEITLYILDFRVEGCEGTGVFGNPVDITSHSGISSMARRCSRKYSSQRNGHVPPNGEGQEVNLDTNSDSGSDSDSDAPSLRPQACASNGSLVSQEQFKSQVPNGRQMEKPRAPPINDPALPKRNATLLISALTSKTGPAAPSEPISVVQEKLGEKRKSNKPHSRQKDVDIEQIGFATQLLLPIEKASSMDEEMNRNGDGGAEMLAQSKSPVARTLRRRISDTRLSPSLNKSRQRNNPDVATRKSREKPTDNTDSHISPGTPKPTTNNRSMPNNSLKTNIQADREDPWRHMTRIRRRDVTIHKDQEELIEKKESWVPPEPGKQPLQAHVPIRLLQEWNDMHRRRSSAGKASSSVAPQSTNEKDDLDADLLKSSPESEMLDPEWTPTQEPPSSSHLVPQDSSPPDLRDTRPSRLSSAGNVLNNEDFVAGENENDLEYGHTISPNSQKAPAFDTTTPIEDEDDDSEMEIRAPNGLGNASQADQGPENGEFTSSGASLPPPNKVSFTEVEQTPYIQASKRKIATKIGTPTNSVRDSGQRYNKVSSDPLIPSTYDNRRLNVYPEPSASTSRKATQSPAQSPGPASTGGLNLLDCGLMDSDDEFMAERQLVSDLDEYTQSTHWGYLDVPITVHAPGTAIDADKPLSSSVDLQGSQIEMNSTSRTIGKRKRHEISPKDSNSTKQRKISKSQAARHNTFSYMAKPIENRSIGSERRQSYFGNDSLPSKIEAVYNRFKEAYTDYTGSLDHFRQACDKLQRLRKQKFMKRSFLWDDFVVLYPAYILQHCDTGDSSHPASYENYFQQEVTKPRCRKRNLTARDLELVLARWENEDSTREASPGQNHSRRSSCASLPVYEQEPSAQENPVGHVLSSDEKADDSQDLSIPESNHGELLSSLKANVVEDLAESSDELEVHETASVELGDPDTSFPLSDSEKEIPSTHEDIDTENEDTLMSDGIAESVQGPYHLPVAPADTRKPRSMSLEIDSDDKSVILESSPSNSSLHESNHEGSRDARQNTSERVDSAKILNVHSQGFLGSQEKYISPPQRSQRPYRCFFRPPPDSPQDPFWNLYNKVKQPGEVKDPDPEQWHKSPNTPFKIYARNVVKLQADRVRRDGSKAHPIPVDEDGVVRPPPLGDQRGMSSMGWKL
ncbi:hypothetical protein EMCG_02590 [[Emmonsia] crescens]|uniref:Shelterin complex subunit TPP1/Est3 domain-containing protein n=1 Tax=[Emmonsia] crescens TaxID=73230 RepID=A0A0G2J1C2_9EURO|nr:hypothetical protein EMCG_02590 [Emmonsia crescens UAMH 3008]